MAKEKFRVDDVGIDLDGLADDLKNQKADFYSESVFDFPEEPSPKSKTVFDDSTLSSSYSEKKTTTRSETSETSEEILDTSDLLDEEETDQTVEDFAKTMPLDTNENDFDSTPIEQDNNLDNFPEEMEEPGIPEETNNLPENNNKSPLNKEDLNKNKDLMDKAKDAKDKIPNDKNSKIPNVGNKGNPLDQIPKKEKKEQPEEEPKEEKKEIDKSPSERRKEKEKRDTDNNTDNIRNAADVAIATHDPTATAIGTIVKKADELTDGKSTELLGKALTINNRGNPVGKNVQKSLNAINESGMGDKLGQAASIINATSGETGGSTPSGQTPPQGKAPSQKPEAKTNKTTNKKEGSTKKSSDKDSGSSETTKKVLDSGFEKIIQFLLTHPFIMIAGFVLIVLALFMTFDDGLVKSGNPKSCTYELNGVTSSDSIKIKDMKVELINCEGTATNYTVLETIDFEKYVLGVALAEVGEDATEEELKAQIIIARNMALTRNKELCPSNPDNCFYGYNKNTGYIRLRACELDRIYWDYEKDIYFEYNDKINLYSPEIKEGSVWKKAIDSSKKKELLSIAETVKGKVLLDKNGKVIPMSNNPLILSDEDINKPYTEILEEYYNSSNYNTNIECK